MKQASFLERMRFSYSYALLQVALRTVKGRLRRRHKLQFPAVMPAVKLERR